MQAAATAVRIANKEEDFISWDCQLSHMSYVINNSNCGKRVQVEATAVKIANKEEDFIFLDY